MKDKTDFCVKIIRYGYEYTLVEAHERVKFPYLTKPSFMGRDGFVLKSFRKLPKP